jgi:dCMP deaminase
MGNNMRPDIDTWALDLSEVVARRSRDPNTQVGAVILRADNTVASVGYNGFPRGTNDDPEIYADKQRKLLRVVHAELNAILTSHEPLHDCTIYVSPLHPCSQCAAAIIQSGIKRVVARTNVNRPTTTWATSFQEATELLQEAGVSVKIYSLSE